MLLLYGNDFTQIFLFPDIIDARAENKGENASSVFEG